MEDFPPIKVDKGLKASRCCFFDGVNQERPNLATFKTCGPIPKVYKHTYTIATTPFSTSGQKTFIDI